LPPFFKITSLSFNAIFMASAAAALQQSSLPQTVDRNLCATHPAQLIASDVGNYGFWRQAG
jgi:hypothetical protein